ncbi:MAG: hypothetical protein JWM98_3137, partial [Thermoleophilia bacterium]|nr:hypothetical protein [Thermoleophilia bacterium]
LADPRGGVWRTGSTEVFEVYPGGALLQWGVHAAGYKRDDARAARGRILDALLQRWPVPDPDALAACVAGDDALDAFAAAIVAHLASCGETIAPDAPLTDPTEGWIHLPVG